MKQTAQLIILLLGFIIGAQAQEAPRELQNFNQERYNTNKKGFLVLGSWSVANIISGICGQASSGGQAKYFHRMDIVWGSVNLLIAVPGYIGARRSNADLSLAASLKGQYAIEKIFLFNAGLDIAYIAGGAWLIEKGNTAGNRDKYKGYGKSVLMQGAFLLMFDAVMFTTHNRHGSKIFRALETLKIEPNSVGLNVIL